MTIAAFLIVDTGHGEQLVRPPLSTDAIGASLRNALGGVTETPPDMLALLRQLECERPARC